MENLRCKICGGEPYQTNGGLKCASCGAYIIMSESVEPQYDKARMEELAAQAISDARQLLYLEKYIECSNAYYVAFHYIKDFFNESTLPNKWEMFFFSEYSKTLHLFKNPIRTFSHADFIEIKNSVLKFLEHAIHTIIFVTKDRNLYLEDIMEAVGQICILSIDVISLVFTCLADHLANDSEFVSVLQSNCRHLIKSTYIISKDKIYSHAMLQAALKALNLHFKLQDTSNLIDAELPALDDAETEQLDTMLSLFSDQFWENNPALKTELESERQKLQDAEAKFIKASKQEYRQLEKEYKAKKEEYINTSSLHPIKLRKLESELSALNVKKRRAKEAQRLAGEGNGKLAVLRKKIEGINQILDKHYFIPKGPMAQIYVKEIKEQLEKIRKM